MLSWGERRSSAVMSRPRKYSEELLEKADRCRAFVPHVSSEAHVTFN